MTDPSDAVAPQIGPTWQDMTIRAKLAGPMPGAAEIIAFLRHVATAIGMEVVEPPIVVEDVDLPRDNDTGRHVHLLWRTSGASVYIWLEARWFYVTLSACKAFEESLVEHIFTSHFQPAARPEVGRTRWLRKIDAPQPQAGEWPVG